MNSVQKWTTVGNALIEHLISNGTAILHQNMNCAPTVEVKIGTLNDADVIMTGTSGSGDGLDSPSINFLVRYEDRDDEVFLRFAPSPGTRNTWLPIFPSPVAKIMPNMAGKLDQSIAEATIRKFFPSGPQLNSVRCTLDTQFPSPVRAADAA